VHFLVLPEALYYIVMHWINSVKIYKTKFLLVLAHEGPYLIRYLIMIQLCWNLWEINCRQLVGSPKRVKFVGFDTRNW